MTRLLFTQPHSPYAPGDIAGVEDELAKKLIKAGIAKEYADKQPTTKEITDAPHDTMVKKAPTTK